MTLNQVVKEVINRVQPSNNLIQRKPRNRIITGALRITSVDKSILLQRAINPTTCRVYCNTSIKAGCN